MVDRTRKKRKESFDRIMRNRGQLEDPAQPERTPVVLYLSGAARRAIAAHRQDRLTTGHGPRLDSIFVEEAVLRHRDATDLKRPRVSDSDESAVLRQALATAQATAEKLRRQLRDMEVEGEHLLTSHRLSFSDEFRHLLMDLSEVKSTDAPVRSRAVHRCVQDYLERLLVRCQPPRSKWA